MKRIFGLGFGAAAAAIAAMCCAAAEPSHLAKVHGTIRDSHGQPISGAKVFLEAGLDGPLIVTLTNAAGGYEFLEVKPGIAGVFAYSPGHAVDGRSATLTIDGDEVIDIALPEAGMLAGTIQDEKNQPIPGVRITRAGIRGSSKVAIPLSKLEEQGLAIAPTDARGGFVVGYLPEGAEVALKFAHPQYAQAAPILRVGTKDARVTLIRGVLVTGTVTARGRDATVAAATVRFVNEKPPNDSVVVRTQTDGTFALRLAPGKWLYSASGANFSTPNILLATIDSDHPNQRVTIQVAGTAPLRGVVRDAKSGNAVAGARVTLKSSGADAARAVTGPTGAYEVSATEGEAVVELASAPGFLLPPEPALRVVVEAGKAVEAPTFWVAPLPKYSLEVIDAKEAPVAGAIVRVLYPEQFGWYATDADGLVNLSFGSLPASGTVIGMVEDPSGPNAAIFAITRERSSDAIVQLMPLTTLTCSVANEKKSALPGVLVEARTTLEGLGRPVTLWRTFSGRDGAARWPAVVPRTPLACFAVAQGAEAKAVSGESKPIVPTADAVANVGAIVLPGGQPGRSALRRKYAWYKDAVLCGELPAGAEHSAAVIVHTPAAQVGMMADGLAQAKRLLNRPGLVFAVVVAEDAPCGEAAVPVLRGEAPTSASTVVVNAEGEVVLECVGLPPVSAINAVAPRN